MADSKFSIVRLINELKQNADAEGHICVTTELFEKNCVDKCRQMFLFIFIPNTPITKWNL